MTGQIHASDDEVIHPSSGNVFADPGLPEPEEDLVKATLAMRITRIVAERGWSQNEAACVMGIDRDAEMVMKPKAAAHQKATMRVSIRDGPASGAAQ